jgi:hypothetical protein
LFEPYYWLLSTRRQEWERELDDTLEVSRWLGAWGDAIDARCAVVLSAHISFSPFLKYVLMALASNT